MDEKEDELRRTVGKRLRIARLTAERTQDDLAIAAGVSRSMVSLIEHGTCGIDVYRLRRMAIATGTTVTALLDDTGGRS